MNKFHSASDAESAFYAAFEQADLDGMMDIWAQNERVVCIHPGAPRMEGLAEVRDSWKQIFDDPPLLKFSLFDVRITLGEDISIHQVREEVEIDGQFISMMLSTNIYERNAEKTWLMTSRHCSPEPEELELEAEDDEVYQDEAVVLH